MPHIARPVTPPGFKTPFAETYCTSEHPKKLIEFFAEIICDIEHILYFFAMVSVIFAIVIGIYALTLFVRRRIHGEEVNKSPIILMVKIAFWVIGFLGSVASILSWWSQAD